MSNEQQAYKKRLLIITALILTIVVSTITYSFNIGSKMTLKYTPLIDAAMEIKLEATTAHLWFEELLTGDRNTDIEDIKQKIDSAIWYAKAMKYGGSNEEGTFIALEDKELIAKIEDVLEQLQEFSEVSDIRYQSFQINENDLYDKRYDEIFYEFIALADVVETRLQEKILEELATFNRIFYFILFASVLFILMTFFVVHHYEKERHEEHEMYIQQARMASMGEMIGNVAHQWRQPLNALGLILQKMGLMHTRGKLDSTMMKKSVNKSMELIQGMSDTIDDFRDFFSPRKSKEHFLVHDAVDKAYSIVEPIFISSSVQYRLESDNTEVRIYGYKNELSQVIVNFMNNAYDALMEKGVDSPKVTINIKTSDDHIYIELSDNAGGVPDDVLPKIFNPYFSTKSERNGTGLGLYMSKMIVEEHMHGKLYVVNTSEGACFTIKLKSL